MGPAAVNFFQPGTEGAVDQGQILRQRELAAMLIKQGMTPQQGQMVSGHYVAPSPLSYVTQIANVLAGRAQQNKADEREQTLIRTLQSQRAQEAKDFMSASTGTPAVPGRSIAPLTQNDDEGNAMPSADVPAQAAIAPDRARAMAIAMQSQNPTLQAMGGEMMKRQMDSEELKDVLGQAGIGNPGGSGVTGVAGGATGVGAGVPPMSGPGVATPATTPATIPGIDPRAMALTLSRLPQAQKLGGMIQEASKPVVLAEGGTALERGPNGFVPAYIAPKTEPGIGVKRGPNGLEAEPVSNYGAAKANIAGQVAGAEARAREAATDPYKPPTMVDTKGGPRLMTPKQQRDWVNGGQDVGAPRGNFTGTPEEILASINSIPAGPDRERARQAYANQVTGNNPAFDSMGTGALPGVALADPNAQKFGGKVAEGSAEALMQGREKASAAADSIRSVQAARAAAQSGVFQGSGADAKLAISKFINANVPGITIDPAKVGDTDYMKSVLGEGMLAQAKTLGANPSNADAQRITDIVGSIGKDPQAMAKLLDWRESMARRTIEGHNSMVQDAEGRGLRSQIDLRVKMPEAPKAGGKSSIDDLLRKYR